MLRSKYFWRSVGIVLSIVFFFWAIWPRPEYVEIAKISEGVFEETIDEDGVTRIKDIYTVAAPVTGRLLRSDLKVGQNVVKAKTVLARIQPAEPAFLDISNLKTAEANVESARAAIVLAESNLAQAKERLRFTKDEVKRANREKRRGRLKKAHVDRAKFDRNLAREAVNVAKAKLTIAQEDFKKAQARLMRPGVSKQSDEMVDSGEVRETASTAVEPDKAAPKNDKKTGSDKKDGSETATAKADPKDEKKTNEDGEAPSKTATESWIYNVSSPVDGQVLTILQGNELTIPAGTPLLRIGDPSQLEIVVDLLSRDAVRVRVGAKAYIEQWGGEGTLHAEVASIEPTGFPKVSALGIVEQRVKVVLEIKDGREKWERLGHDYHVQVRIVVWRNENTVTVPVAALFRRGDGWAVFRARYGRATLTNVEIGHRNREQAEVIKGLSAGDEVIIYPSDKVIDGVLVDDRDNQETG